MKNQTVAERLEAKYEQLTTEELCYQLRQLAAVKVASMPVAALMREAADRLEEE